ncbi:MAG: ATP-dependent DNA helicase RecG [Verrucomicrobia bacterium]|nr:ATP-dependent DNA helicase RecG [Verrucomicrobiota bacterium]
MGRVHGRTPVADGRLALSPEQNRIRKAAESLAERLGLSGPEQLAGYLPRRHEDRQGGWHPSQGLPEGPVNFQGTVTRSKLNRWRGRRCMVEVDVEVAGNMGGLVRLVFYNLPFMARAFPEGKRVAVFGRAEEKKGVFVFAHPETETVEEGKEEGIHLDRVVPVYPLTEGVSQRRVRSVLYHYLKEFWPTLEEVFPGLAGIPTRSQAWKTLHFPGSLREVEIARRSLAHEELLGMQFTLRVRRAAREAIRVERPGKTRDLVEPWRKSLPWPMTSDQARACGEIDGDLALGRPMHRLLQGDVGSGKTLVAAHALLRGLEHGTHVALMAPTTLLVEQHAASLRKLLPRGVLEVVTWTSDSKPGPVGLFPRITVGTHALFAEKTRLSRLSLCVIDEQQRFGVRQRAAFLAKGERPDLLVLTATPIPRTYDLLLHGDLDVSLLREMPPGRGEVRTHVRDGAVTEKIWAHLRERVIAGDRVYVVVPRLGEEVMDPAEEASVKRTHEQLSTVIGRAGVALLHGRQKEGEKIAILEKFRKGEIAVLVATTVVEVGVDVPEANWMVIDHADRLGLSQLHQLRGRIGRGGRSGNCVLIQRSGGPVARQRLEFLAQNRDGFKIAEEDYRLRGPGDILGEDQSGIPRFRFARLPEDLPLLQVAQQEAGNLMRGDWRQWKGLVEAEKRAKEDVATN